MKKILIILLSVFLSFALYSQNKKVLFLGNSYTASNGTVPAMLENISTSLGKTINTDYNTPGGYRLKNHSENSTSIDKIFSENWDYVVLQEQSQIPSFSPAQVDTMCYPYAKKLCDTIYYNDSCTTPLFFMTWGRENGDSYNCASYPPVCTYEGMQGRLRTSYIEMAFDNNAEVAPVGVVWKAIREDYPTIDLYTPDESHPSLNGTYLASCVFYASIFHESPLGAYYPSGVDSVAAANMQEYAGNIVMDSSNTWNIDTISVKANFIPMFPTSKSVTGGFLNLSLNADSSYWNFGDGTDTIQTDILYFPEIFHTFQTAGWYNVCLTSYRNCDMDKYCDSIHTDFFVGQQIETQNEDLLYFDYTNKKLIFSEAFAGERIWIYDTSGRLIGTEKLYSGNVLDNYKGIVIIKLSNKTLKLNLSGE